MNELNITNVSNQQTMTTNENQRILGMVTQQKVYEQNKEIIVNTNMANLANGRAEREPLPDIISEAIDTQDIIVQTSVGKVTVRRMKAIDITIFKLIKSPLYKLMMGDIDAQDENVVRTLFPDEELLFSLVYQFTTDARTVYKAAKDNKYDETVLDEVGAKYNLPDITKLVEVIIQSIGLVNKGRIEFESPVGEDGKKKLNM